MSFAVWQIGASESLPTRSFRPGTDLHAGARTPDGSQELALRSCSPPVRGSSDPLFPRQAHGGTWLLRARRSAAASRRAREIFRRKVSSVGCRASRIPILLFVRRTFFR